MRTSELTGALLNYWTAMAEGWQLDGSLWRLDGTAKQMKHLWTPTSSWAQGGPIVEREQMYLEFDADGFWIASTPTTAHIRGSTALEAAMRAFVASKFGETVAEQAAA